MGWDVLKTVTYQRSRREASVGIARRAASISEAEGMMAHAESAKIRILKYEGAESGGSPAEGAYGAS